MTNLFDVSFNSKDEKADVSFEGGFQVKFQSEGHDPFDSSNIGFSAGGGAVPFGTQTETIEVPFEQNNGIQFQSEDIGNAFDSGMNIGFSGGGNGGGTVNVISDGDPSPLHAWSSEKVNQEIQKVREDVEDNAQAIEELQDAFEDIRQGASSGEQVERNRQAIAEHEELLQQYQDAIDGKMDEPSGDRAEGRVPMIDPHGNVVWVDQTIAQSVEAANRLKFAREITLTGQVSGSASFDGSSDIEIYSVVSKMTNEDLEGMLRL